MAESAIPETRYARSGDVNIAYQTIGAGPLDIVIVPGAISHVEFIHELSGYTAFLQRLSRFARVVSFDKRGQGLSDRVSGVPSLEERMDDVRAVIDAIGSKRCVLVGFSDGAAMSILFATTYPRYRISLSSAVSCERDIPYQTTHSRLSLARRSRHGAPARR
jgi:pimeloyl-ACP methyl ester carboxylesterase